MSPPVASAILDHTPDDVAAEYATVSRYLTEQKKSGAEFRVLFNGAATNVSESLCSSAKPIEPAILDIITKYSENKTARINVSVALVPPGQDLAMINGVDHEAVAFYENDPLPQELNASQKLQPALNYGAGELQAGGRLAAEDRRWRVIVQMSRAMAASAVNETANFDPSQPEHTYDDKITAGALALGALEKLSRAPRLRIIQGGKQLNNLLQQNAANLALRKLDDKQKAELLAAVNALRAREQNPHKQLLLAELGGKIMTGDLTLADVRAHAAVKDQPGLSKLTDKFEKSHALDAAMERLRAKADSDPAYAAALERLTEARETLEAGGDVTTLLTIASEMEQTGAIDLQLKQLDELKTAAAAPDPEIKQAQEASAPDAALMDVKPAEPALDEIALALETFKLSPAAAALDMDELAEQLAAIQAALTAAAPAAIDTAPDMTFAEPVMLAPSVQDDMQALLKEAGVNLAQFDSKPDEPLTLAQAADILTTLQQDAKLADNPALQEIAQHVEALQAQQTALNDNPQQDMQAKIIAQIEAMQPPVVDLATSIGMATVAPNLETLQTAPAAAPEKFDLDSVLDGAMRGRTLDSASIMLLQQNSSNPKARELLEKYGLLKQDTISYQPDVQIVQNLTVQSPAGGIMADIAKNGGQIRADQMADVRLAAGSGDIAAFNILLGMNDTWAVEEQRKRSGVHIGAAVGERHIEIQLQQQAVTSHIVVASLPATDLSYVTAAWHNSDNPVSGVMGVAQVVPQSAPVVQEVVPVSSFAAEPYVAPANDNNLQNDRQPAVPPQPDIDQRDERLEQQRREEQEQLHKDQRREEDQRREILEDGRKPDEELGKPIDWHRPPENEFGITSPEIEMEEFVCPYTGAKVKAPRGTSGKSLCGGQGGTTDSKAPYEGTGKPTAEAIIGMCDGCDGTRCGPGNCSKGHLQAAQKNNVDVETASKNSQSSIEIKLTDIPAANTGISAMFASFDL